MLIVLFYSCSSNGRISFLRQPNIHTTGTAPIHNTGPLSQSTVRVSPRETDPQAQEQERTTAEPNKRRLRIIGTVWGQCELTGIHDTLRRNASEWNI